jgi:D-proline reductase (dithiol) PrdB
VGLVQREIEAAGMSTITISPMPEWTAALGVPRVVGIEHPLGVTIGRPGDVATQTAVVRDTLQALAGMQEPGEAWHLPYKWEEQAGEPDLHPYPPPPITQAIMKRPWLFRNLMNGNIPD